MTRFASAGAKGSRAGAGSPARLSAPAGYGDLIIRYGSQRFETSVMVALVIVLMILVCGIQCAGDRLVARLDRRV